MIFINRLFLKVRLVFRQVCLFIYGDFAESHTRLRELYSLRQLYTFVAQRSWLSSASCFTPTHPTTTEIQNMILWVSHSVFHMGWKRILRHCSQPLCIQAQQRSDRNNYCHFKVIKSSSVQRKRIMLIVPREELLQRNTSDYFEVEVTTCALSAGFTK